MGIGTSEEPLVPVQVRGLPDMVALFAEDGYSLGLRADGAVWRWGKVPVRMDTLAEVTLLDTGRSRAFALSRDGQRWAWGSNVYGDLGNGTSGADTSMRDPIQVP